MTKDDTWDFDCPGESGDLWSLNRPRDAGAHLLLLFVLPLFNPPLFTVVDTTGQAIYFYRMARIDTTDGESSRLYTQRFCVGLLSLLALLRSPAEAACPFSLSFSRS